MIKHQLITVLFQRKSRMSYQPSGPVYNAQPGYGTASSPYGPPPAGAYQPGPPAGAYQPGPPAGAYQPSYQQPTQQTVYVYEDGRRSRAQDDAQLAEDCCLLACCWTLLCCCCLGAAN
ncbi:hypothetical protein ScPMuIL_005096 [Solemya velum]